MVRLVWKAFKNCLWNCSESDLRNKSCPQILYLDYGTKRIKVSRSCLHSVWFPQDLNSQRCENMDQFIKCTSYINEGLIPIWDPDLSFNHARSLSYARISFLWLMGTPRFTTFRKFKMKKKVIESISEVEQVQLLSNFLWHFLFAELSHLFVRLRVNESMKGNL